MEQKYNEKMSQLGYNNLVCDIFINWENVKDEILLPERKKGSGNGTIHVFLGAADSELRKEFASYYEAVQSGEDPSEGAVKVKHYFMITNVVSMMGYVCKYLRDKNEDMKSFVVQTLDYLNQFPDESGLLYTTSLLKLSIGSSKLRPYFKQFDSNGVFSKLIRNILLPETSYKVSLYKNEEGEYAAFWLIGFDWQNSFEADSCSSNLVKQTRLLTSKIDLPLQQIYYGAPGTGKSYEINEITKKHSAIRTTFHPDSDYSTFVGAYKPVMSQVDLRDVSGHVVIEDGKKIKEERITYKYVKQAFLKAYLAAWQKFALRDGTTDAQFLIIEEINRGNCAQIFGDLFQLLDRADNGFSTYPIEADTDLQTEISKAFGEGGEYALGEGFNIDGVVSGYDGITEAVKEGRVLLLPDNLYIWATMNTSDQSLFPIDSAFKRRWDWKYVKITDAKKGWKIKCGSEECDWWTFVTEINKKIAKETSSDDKKLGYFFCKPDKNGNTISEDKFVGKVLFYLWNDVFKDGDTSLFKVGEYTEEATFEAFYKDDNTVNIEAIRKFLVAVVGDNNIKSGSEEGPSLDGNPSNGIDYTKYSFNGETRLSKKDLGYKIVMKYINEHSDKTFEELQKDLAFDESVDNKYRYKGVLAKVEDINGSYQDCFGDEQTSSDSVNYKVLTWWNKYNIDFIINFAKKQGWSVEKETE